MTCTGCRRIISTCLFENRTVVLFHAAVFKDFGFTFKEESKMKQARSRKKGDFFKKLKLSTRMSLFLGVITFLFLTALLYYLIHSFEIAIDKKIDDNLSDKAKTASSGFESVVSKVESISDNLLYGVQMILSAPPETPGAAPVNPWKIATADGAEP